MNKPATLIAPSTVRFERLLPGPLERVWAYLVEPEKRARWLAAGELDLRVGGKIELLFDNDCLTEEKAPPGAPGEGKHRFEGRITRLEPMRLLAHTWSWDGRDSEVTYELAPKGKEVLLTIHHRLPDDAGIRVAVGGGWATHVGILEDLLKGAKPRPFWTTHEREMQAFQSSQMGG